MLKAKAAGLKRSSNAGMTTSNWRAVCRGGRRRGECARIRAPCRQSAVGSRLEGQTSKWSRRWTEPACVRRSFEGPRGGAGQQLMGMLLMKW